MIRFNDRRVSNGRNGWIVSGHIERDQVILTRIEGDINDEAGLREAVAALLDSRKIYQHALAGV